MSTRKKLIKLYFNLACCIAQRSRASSQVELVTTEKEIYQTSSTRKNIFRRLLAMNSPEWITMLIGCIACVLNGLSQSVFPILLTKIVTAFKNCGYADTSYRVLMASSYFLLLGVIVMLLFLAQYVAFAISGSKLVQRIRSKAFSCLLRQEVDYFDRPENSSTAICVRLSSNAAALQDMTGTRLGVVCEALSLLIFGLIFGLIFNWKLTVIAFIPFLLLGIFICLAMETINNMRTVKQFSAENEILRQYTDLIQQIPKVSWRSDLINAISLSASWDLDSFIVVLLSYCSLALVKSNQLPMENIITVFAFITFTTQSIKLIAILSYRIGSSITAANIFFDLFDRTPSIDNTSTQGQELARFHGNIDYDKVKFAYPTRSTSVILNKLQINIKSGQRVALVGTSGCGKSTIVQLLERFYDTTQGQLLLDGVDIRQLNIKWLRSRLGLISQEPVLFDLTIAENITYALDNISMEEIIKAAKKANIHNFIQQLPQGYETRVGVKGSFLSGGEKQRIAIARVLLRQPKVLLLDEATSALDSHNEQIVQHTLDQAQAEDLSRTSIIIAHRLSTICSCDVIYVLDEGRVVENGTHAELLQQRGIYYKLFFAQNN
ncbi:unnamed protein product [Adineta ricciae]|uniref:Uncharacterized protein n=1 Tax=Adineta ricciae TaxID=249248 RepID=A0A815ZT30_ADIRI|nr:unnamed protein product [Adineta ricciae]